MCRLPRLQAPDLLPDPRNVRFLLAISLAHSLLAPRSKKKPRKPPRLSMTSTAVSGSCKIQNRDR